MSERENGHCALTTRTLRNRISADVWEQIKTGYAAGVGLREIARKMNIPEGTVLARSKREGWTQKIQAATGQMTPVQSDAITAVQSVPQSLAAILAHRKNRTRVGLSKYTAEAAEQAADSGGDLSLARNVRDVAAIHSTLWPVERGEGILDVAFLVGKVTRAPISVNGNEQETIDVELGVSE